ncbi:drug resistance transporter EmrB/QacA subfamily [Brachyspira sp. CAG:484]|nr:drug resistance transporter EmrB/QacA subfamily [Brachyspira sp. CAG:484]
MSESISTEQEWRPGINPWLMITPVMLAIFMFVLDETISNVALTYIAGSMSVSLNESTWVLTSYLIASGIAIPLVAAASKLFGRKNYFMICTIVFTISSFLCAISHSMIEIVLARFLQGLGGGGLLPLGQSIMLESFPKKDRPKSMAIFGIAVIFAPLIGPVLGGWITENWSWPWIYLINVPLGFLCVYLSKNLLEEPPYAKKQKNVHFDFKGMIFLSGWLIALQVVLDKGNDADWFGAAWICWLSAISMIFAILFFISQARGKEPLIDLTVLKDRTYFFGTLVQVILMGVFLSSAALLPSMLQNLLGYTAYLSGLSMGSRGVGSFIGVALYLTLSKKLGDRRIVMIGLILLGLGSVFFGMINLQINLTTIALPNILYGSGLFLALTPLIPLSFSTIKNENMTNATGLQNLVKNIGGAIGTSLGTTMVARFAQVHQNMLINHLHDTNNTFVERVNALTGTFSSLTDTFTAHTMAQSQIYSQLIQQSHLWAYIDTFRWFAFATFLLIPMLVFIKKPKSLQ